MARHHAMAPLTEAVLGLLPSTGDVERPGRADARLAGLDEFRQGDVDDSLAAGLGTGDAQEAVDLLAEALACGPRELVAEAVILLLAWMAGPVVSAGLMRFAIPHARTVSCSATAAA